MDEIESFNISVRHTHITQKGITKLFNSMSSVKNFMMNLGGTAISDQAVDLFVERTLSSMKALESFEFCVYEAPITDQSILKLLLEFKAVKRFVLDIRETKVTNKSIEFFIQEKLPTMKSILESIEIKTTNSLITESQRKILDDTLLKI